jgi:hypothetical protein
VRSATTCHDSLLKERRIGVLAVKALSDRKC